MDSAKIYINGELLGYCKDPESFTNEMREKRRNGEVSHEMNITYYDKIMRFIYSMTQVGQEDH